MSRAPETADGGGAGGTIKVGATGTISSLMSRELESVKDTAQASATSVKKLQTAPVSVPCGYSPKRSQLRRNPPLEPGSSSGSRSPVDVQKPKPRRNGRKNKSTGAGDAEKKGGRTCTVEVVDLKCSNPMSSRLRKLGFSRLSESIA